MGSQRHMTIALIVSAAIHLSMVTLFSIGIWFPLERRVYYSFEIREERAAAGAARLRNLEDSLRLPDVPELLGAETQRESMLDLESPDAALPNVELPRLPFTEFERLQLHSEALDARSRLDVFRSDRDGDSWARLGNELARLSDTLADLNPFERTSSDPVDDLAPAGPVELAAPAPGFEAYVDWLSGADDRDVLLAPPIEALLDVDPRDWQEPMSVVLKVNRDGRVVEILSPLDPDSPIMARIWRAILSYRFEPVGADAPEIQHGTLFIAATPDPL